MRIVGGHNKSCERARWGRRRAVEDQSRRKAALISERLAHARIDFPPHAKVEGKPGGGLEVVLEKARHFAGAIALVIGSLSRGAGKDVAVQAAVLRCALPEKEIGESLKRQRAAELVRIVEIELIDVKFVSRAEGVAAICKRDLIGGLPGIYHGKRIVVSGPAQNE